jgi:MOSC domain-containing protein YiiM
LGSKQTKPTSHTHVKIQYLAILLVERSKKQGCLMNIQEGQLIGIAIREKSRGSMIERSSSNVTAAYGLEGDFRGKPDKRQVTVMSKEDWTAACEVMGKPMHWTTRRANLLVEGIKLLETTGSLIRIGKLTLKVTGETDPCGRMDELHAGLRRALTPDWRGGVCCRVLSDGKIDVGAKVTLESEKIV